MSLPAAEVAQLLTSDAPVVLRTPSGVNSGMLGALWPFGASSQEEDQPNQLSAASLSMWQRVLSAVGLSKAQPGSKRKAEADEPADAPAPAPGAGADAEGAPEAGLEEPPAAPRLRGRPRKRQRRTASPPVQVAGAASRSPGPSQSAAGTSSRDLRSNTASKTRSLVIRGGSSAPQASGASTRSRRAPGRARKPAVKAGEAAGAGAASQPQLPPAAASAVAAASPDTPQLAGEGCGTDQLVFDRRKLEQQMAARTGLKLPTVHRQVHDIMVLAAAIKGEEVVEDPIDLTWAAEPLKVIEWLAKDTGEWSTNRDRYQAVYRIINTMSALNGGEELARTYQANQFPSGS